MTEREVLKLAKCPFCGSEAHFDHDDNGWNWIECGSCGACTNARVSAMDDCKPLLAEQWNRRKAQPEQEPEFVTHNVDKPYDWSEWVCPNPSGYLMKCCDCGLVHEAEFGVVRYKSETEREDCDMVNDPNLQAVFRMRRSEKWSPEDTAHRAGGLPMAQPEQEPVEWYSVEGETRRYGVGMVECAYAIGRDEVVHVVTHESVKDVAMKHLPTQRTWVGLTHSDIDQGLLRSDYAFKTAEAWRAGVVFAMTKLKQKNGYDS